ncbi:hypothetical protein [Archangium sp.]|uniref:hypothetical protein n=1 Tax=Archangium sp. TaxID=1872627 RepID=UPI002D6D92EE|nr:hypothetical protein [Archangium sp.]HYO59183.1 hypothetical protein [Archangium sp.]
MRLLCCPPGRAGHRQPEQVSKGFTVNRLVAGGRWLITDFRNETSVTYTRRR